jgi:hypothetical protein
VVAGHTNEAMGGAGGGRFRSGTEELRAGMWLVFFVDESATTERDDLAARCAAGGRSGLAGATSGADLIEG